MDVWGLTVAAMRRWYVLIPLLVVSLAFAYVIGSGSDSQSEHEVDGAVVLLAPPSVPVPTGANPYAGSSAAQLLTIQATSSATREAFREEGLSDDYRIFYESRSPVISLTVSAGSEQLALDTGEGVVAYLRTTLADSQEELGVDEPDRVTLGVVDAPDVVNPVEAGAMRLTAVIGVLGIVLSFAIAVFVDAVFTRRKSRTLAGTTDAPQSDSEPKAA